MKVILLSVFLFALHLTPHAQFKVIAEGPFLNDPKTGSEKIILLKNGNTFYLSLKKDGIRVRVYNESHKQTVDKRAKPDLGKPSSFSIRGIFEVNDDVAVFISDVDEHQMVLHRLVIDAKTGVLKQTDKIEDLKRFSYAKGFGLIFGVPIPDFYVEKMPDGNGYVIALMNSFESDRNKRISVVVYGGDHKELNRAYYNSPDDKFKYMRYIGMAVPDADHICVMAYAYNTRTSGGKECELVMATMNKTAPEMVLNELNTITKPRGGEVLKYSPVSKKLYFLHVAANTNSPFKAIEHDCAITIIDPYTAKVVFNGDVYTNSKNKSMDSPQDLVVNQDGSFAVIYEDVRNNDRINGNRTYIWANLGDLTVTQFDATGKSIGNFTIQKNFVLSDYSRSVLFNAKLNAWGTEMFNYLSTPANNFILLNDEPENLEKAKEGHKLSKVKSMDDCDGAYYTLKGNAESGLLFGNGGKDDHPRGKFWVYDYDAARNIYVTIKLQKKGEDYDTRLVWMQP